MNNSNFFPLERNRYFYGKMLTARDFETEQRYFNNKRRLLNRTLYGAGRGLRAGRLPERRRFLLGGDRNGA